MEDIAFYNSEIDLSYCDMFLCFSAFKVHERDTIFAGEPLNSRKSQTLNTECSNERICKIVLSSTYFTIQYKSKYHSWMIYETFVNDDIYNSKIQVIKFVTIILLLSPLPPPPPPPSPPYKPKCMKIIIW